jgi:hypothetical protein
MIPPSTSTVRGNLESGVAFFRGISYAEPPVGGSASPHRSRPRGGTGAWSALSMAPTVADRRAWPGPVVPGHGGRRLTVNVWAPDPTSRCCGHRLLVLDDATSSLDTVTECDIGRVPDGRRGSAYTSGRRPPGRHRRPGRSGRLAGPRPAPGYAEHRAGRRGPRRTGLRQPCRRPVVVAHRVSSARRARRIPLIDGAAATVGTDISLRITSRCTGTSSATGPPARHWSQPASSATRTASSRLRAPVLRRITEM